MQDEMKKKLENTILKSCKYHFQIGSGGAREPTNEWTASIWKIIWVFFQILFRYDESDMDMSEDDQDELGKKFGLPVDQGGSKHSTRSVGRKNKKSRKKNPRKKNKKRQNLVKKINIEGRKERPVQKIDYFSILKNSDGM